MQPVVIVRHSPTEGPGYFATFLEAHRIPWRLVAIDRGEPLPESLQACSGLAFMGGPMSVNDLLSWIEPACSLIRAAVAEDVPVIGHCLGGQLMSKALGGCVSRNPVKEIGWGSATAVGSAIAERWLGDLATRAELTVFQWHGETFSLPPGATHLMQGRWCANQVFVIGPHLAMQCHVEMTPALIESWCESWPDEIRGLVALPPSVQSPETMIAETAQHLPAMRALADRLYTRWIANLRR